MRVPLGNGGNGTRETAEKGHYVDYPQRQVLELAFFEGLTQVEIAERTQIPLGTVKTRTLLAMKKLRAALRDEIVVLHCDRGLSGSLSGSGTLIVD